MLDYIIKGFLLSWKGAHMQLGTLYQMIPKRPMNIFNIDGESVSWKFKK